MLRILDKNKVPVKGLRKYSDLCIENSIELDDKTLTFSVPYRNVRSQLAFSFGCEKIAIRTKKTDSWSAWKYFSAQ